MRKSADRFLSIFPLFPNLFSWRTVTKVLFRKKGILGLAAVNESRRSELHLSRGRTGLGRGGPGAPPLPPAGPSTAGGPG